MTSTKEADLLEWAGIMLATTNDEVFKDHMVKILEATDTKEVPTKEHHVEDLLLSVAEGCNTARRCYAKLTRSWPAKEHAATKRLNALTDRQLIQEFASGNAMMVAAMLSFLGGAGEISRKTKQITIADEIIMIFVRECIRFNLLLKSNPVQKISMMSEWRADYAANIVTLNRVTANLRPDNPLFVANPDLLSVVPLLQIFASIAALAYTGMHTEYIKKIYPS